MAYAPHPGGGHDPLRGGVRPVRVTVHATGAVPPGVLQQAYTGVVDSALAVDGSLTGGTGAELGPEARVLLE
ncbi:hypothetical protein, partial [Streptomyces sp. NPDC054838]